MCQASEPLILRVAQPYTLNSLRFWWRSVFMQAHSLLKSCGLALHRFGFANRAESVSRADGMMLHDCFITAAGRCAPPGNRPTPAELGNCRDFLEAEIALLRRVRLVVTLGRVAHEQWLKASGWWERLTPAGRPGFGHGASTVLPSGLAVLSSFHPSRQNTNTGRLTRPMWHAVFRKARRLIGVS